MLSMFNVLFRFRTVVSVICFTIIWTIFLIAFAAIYVAIDNENPRVDCGLGTADPPSPIGFHAAFAFSLETTTTVGTCLSIS